MTILNKTIIKWVDTENKVEEEEEESKTYIDKL